LLLTVVYFAGSCGSGIAKGQVQANEQRPVVAFKMTSQPAPSPAAEKYEEAMPDEDVEEAYEEITSESIAKSRGRPDRSCNLYRNVEGR
jgi:hypothetical protein